MATKPTPHHVSNQLLLCAALALATLACCAARSDPNRSNRHGDSDSPPATPDKYYVNIDTAKSDDAFRAQLTDLISEHHSISYSALWDAFEVLGNGGQPGTCPAHGVGEDPYSSKCWSPNTRCGNYQREGDCFNREHSLPKSWWGSNKGSKAYSDLFHLFPTDGYVNNLRSSLPYGPVKRDRSLKYTSSNGAVLGACALEAHMPSGQACFEPSDAWKGELARGSLYMAIAYADAGFSCCDNFAVTSGLPNDAYLRTLLAWHVAHPPSAAERARNEVIYARYQQNRNPFIDHPEWAALAWPQLVADVTSSRTARGLQNSSAGDSETDPEANLNSANAGTRAVTATDSHDVTVPPADPQADIIRFSPNQPHAY